MSEPDAGQNAQVAPYQDAPKENQSLGVSCDFDIDCDDGAFCNGRERCFDGECYSGDLPKCDDGIECTRDHCSHLENNCVFSAPDEDGDGHADAECIGPDDEPLGDDCDDDDANRFPGNNEVCAPDEPGHDEDCDPETIGHLDADQDGVISSLCCNEGEDGEDICGDDCDDDNFRRYPAHPEICDDIDNDCDGQVDVNTREVPWYPDVDGDNFGDAGGDSILSCAPLEDRALAASDCDDQTSAVNVAAVESCDGVDNDCDGDVDEDNVCACAPNGNVRPCACGATRTGVQACSGGLWARCNCDECVDGAVDCLAGILPRLCVDGQWVFQQACQGALSECNDGVCTCPGGGTECDSKGGSGGATAGSGGTGVGGATTGSGGTVSNGGGIGLGGAGGAGDPVQSNFVSGGRGTSQGGEWDGYAWTVAEAGSSIDPSAFDSDNLCVTGVLGPAYEEFAAVGWNIAQEIDSMGEGGVVNAIEPTGTGVYVEVENFGSTPLRVVIQADEQGAQQWCAAINSSGDTIPWGDFSEECWLGGGAAYDGVTPISSILIQTYSESDISSTDFDFCVVDISPY